MEGEMISDIEHTPIIKVFKYLLDILIAIDGVWVLQLNKILYILKNYYI